MGGRAGERTVRLDSSVDRREIGAVTFKGAGSFTLSLGILSLVFAAGMFYMRLIGDETSIQANSQAIQHLVTISQNQQESNAALAQAVKDLKDDVDSRK